MAKYKIVIEYNGANFHGWQRQVNPHTTEVLRTVQGTIEDAIFNITGQHVTVDGAGRTDRGVHATGQVAHFVLEEVAGKKNPPPHRLLDALNFYVQGHGASILAVTPVGEDFHARFSATYRQYEYKIINRRAPLTIDIDRAWQVSQPLDVELMQQAANFLIGYHDFSAFRAAECQSKNPCKTLDVFQLQSFHQGGAQHITATIRSRSFLHNQVRIMMGTLKMVGEGKWRPEDVLMILESRDRKKAGPTAPPFGLYLTMVGY